MRRSAVEPDRCIPDCQAKYGIAPQNPDSCVPNENQFAYGIHLDVRVHDGNQCDTGLNNLCDFRITYQREDWSLSYRDLTDNSNYERVDVSDQYSAQRLLRGFWLRLEDRDDFSKNELFGECIIPISRESLQRAAHQGRSNLIHRSCDKFGLDYYIERR